MLSDNTGLLMWRELTKQPNYYQTEVEARLIVNNAREISSFVEDGTIIMDLGCGDIRKIVALLDVLEKQQKSITYYALDLSRESLELALDGVGSGYTKVECCGLWGNWDKGIEWSTRTLDESRPRLYLSLGSIFGNDHIEPAIARLKSWSEVALDSCRSSMLLTMDATMDKEKLMASYNDNGGLYESFIRNGFRHTNRILGEDWYKDEDWEHRGELQDEPRMHRSVMRAKRVVKIVSVGLRVEEGTELDCYENFKYSPEVMEKQFEAAGLTKMKTWKAPDAHLYQYLLKMREP
ncbi:unnamed protein product [Discula destructiva]